MDVTVATKATAIYLRHVEDYDDETKAVFDRGGTPLEYPDQHVTTDVKDSQADIAKARRILGYEPIVSFEDGLAKTVNWYRSSPVSVA